MMRGILFQDWITLQGQGNLTPDPVVVQSEPFWLDLGDYRDVIAWLDVRSWSADAGLQLTYQTGVTKEEALFYTLGGPVTFAVGLTVTQMLSGVLAPSRYFRWKVAPTAPTVTAWNATFRVLLALNRPGNSRRATFPSNKGVYGGDKINGLPKIHDPRESWGTSVPRGVPQYPPTGEKPLPIDNRDEPSKPLKQSPWIQK